MDNRDRHISGLWAEAKKEAPHKSFTEMEADFSKAAPGGGESSGFDSIINLNSIIMSSIALVAVGLVWTFWPTSDPVKQESVINRSEVQSSSAEPINQRTVVYTEPLDHVLEVDVKSEKDDLPVDDLNTSQKNPGLTSNTEVIVASEKRPDAYVKQGASWDHGGITKHHGNLQKEKEVVFIITNETTIEEMENIKALADGAGIELTYRTRGNIKKINLTMSLITAQGQSQTSLTLDGKFRMTIGWWQDDEGRATRFSKGTREEDYQIFEEGEEPLFDTVERPESPPSPGLFDRAKKEMPEPSIEAIDPIPPQAPLQGAPSEEMPEIEEGQERVIIQIDRTTTDAEIKGYTGSAEEAGLTLEVINFKPNGKSLKVKLLGPESQTTIHTEVDTREDPMQVRLGYLVDAHGAFVRFLEREEVEIDED